MSQLNTQMEFKSSVESPLHAQVLPIFPTARTSQEVEAAPPPPRAIAACSNKFIEVVRASIAEFFGLAVFVFFGAAADCQAVLSTSTNVASNPKGDWITLSFGWAVGLSLAVWTTAEISGGHVNPAITLALATWKGFSWKKVPCYIFAQVLGGVVGAALAYANYVHAIDLFEGGSGIRTPATAGLFAPFPLPYMPAVASFFDEFLGTMLLAFVIMAVTDKRNAAPSLHLLPIAIFIVLLGLGVSMGMQTSFSFNPARDFGPRLFLTMVGYGSILYTYQGWYWLWGGILAPIVGAQVGVGLYHVFLHCPDPDPEESTGRRLEKV